jgi:hypothetical protein
VEAFEYGVADKRGSMSGDRVRKVNDNDGESWS